MQVLLLLLRLLPALLLFKNIELLLHLLVLLLSRLVGVAVVKRLLKHIAASHSYDLRLLGLIGVFVNQLLLCQGGWVRCWHKVAAKLHGCLRL